MSFTFKIVGLFVPRLLLLWHYVNGTIPANDIPSFWDFALGLFAPRVWILIAGWEEFTLLWVVLYVVAMLSTGKGGHGSVNQPPRKRTAK